MRAYEFNPFDYLETDTDRARYVAECVLEDAMSEGNKPVMTPTALAYAERKLGKMKAISIYTSAVIYAATDDEITRKFREIHLRKKDKAKRNTQIVLRTT